MSRIKHPNPQAGTFTDRIGGVVFHDGFAEVDLVGDDNLRDAYLMHGYEVEETPIETFAEPEANTEAYIPLKPRPRKKD